MSADDMKDLPEPIKKLKRDYELTIDRVLEEAAAMGLSATRKENRRENKEASQHKALFEEQVVTDAVN